MSGWVVSCRVMAGALRSAGWVRRLGRRGTTWSDLSRHRRHTKDAGPDPGTISQLGGRPSHQRPALLLRAVWSRTAGRPVCSWFRCVTVMSTRSDLGVRRYATLTRLRWLPQLAEAGGTAGVHAVPGIAGTVLVCNNQHPASHRRRLAVRLR